MKIAATKAIAATTPATTSTTFRIPETIPPRRDDVFAKASEKTLPQNYQTFPNTSNLLGKLTPQSHKTIKKELNFLYQNRNLKLKTQRIK